MKATYLAITLALSIGQGSVRVDGEAVSCLAFSPDGKMIVGGAYGGTVTIWDADTRKELAVLKGHHRLMLEVLFSPDSKKLAVVSGDYVKGPPNEVKLWDLAKNVEIGTFQGAKDATTQLPVTAVAFSRDSKALATGSGNDDFGEVKLWDAGTGKQIAVLEGHKGTVRVLTFSPDGEILASGGADEVVKLWNLADRSELATLKAHKGRITAIAFSADGKTLATAAEWDAARLWNLAKREEQRTLTLPHISFDALAFSPDGKWVATGGGEAGVDPVGRVTLWDASTGKVRHEFERTRERVMLVAFTADGKTLVSSGYQDVVSLWDVASGELRARVGDFIKDTVDAWALSAEGKTLATSDVEYPPMQVHSVGVVKFWNVAQLLKQKPDK